MEWWQWQRTTLFVVLLLCVCLGNAQSLPETTPDQWISLVDQWPGALDKPYRVRLGCIYYTPYPHLPWSVLEASLAQLSNLLSPSMALTAGMGRISIALVSLLLWDANRSSTILPNVTLDLLLADDYYGMYGGAASISDWFDHMQQPQTSNQTILMFGNAGRELGGWIAERAAFWDVPFLPTYTSLSSYGTPRQYPTTSALFVPMYEMGKAVISLCRLMHWKKIAVVGATNSDTEDFLLGLYTYAEQAQVEVTSTQRVVELSTSYATLRAMIASLVRSQTWIIVFNLSAQSASQIQQLMEEFQLHRPPYIVLIIGNWGTLVDRNALSHFESVFFLSHYHADCMVSSPEGRQRAVNKFQHLWQEAQVHAPHLLRGIQLSTLALDSFWFYLTLYEHAQLIVQTLDVYFAQPGTLERMFGNDTSMVVSSSSSSSSYVLEPTNHEPIRVQNHPYLNTSLFLSLYQQQVVDWGFLFGETQSTASKTARGQDELFLSTWQTHESSGRLLPRCVAKYKVSEDHWMGVSSRSFSSSSSSSSSSSVHAVNHNYQPSASSSRVRKKDVPFTADASESPRVTNMEFRWSDGSWYPGAVPPDRYRSWMVGESLQGEQHVGYVLLSTCISSVTMLVTFQMALQIQSSLHVFLLSVFTVGPIGFGISFTTQWVGFRLRDGMESPVQPGGAPWRDTSPWSMTGWLVTFLYATGIGVLLFLCVRNYLHRCIQRKPVLLSSRVSVSSFSDVPPSPPSSRSSSRLRMAVEGTHLSKRVPPPSPVAHSIPEEQVNQKPSSASSSVVPSASSASANLAIRLDGGLSEQGLPNLVSGSESILLSYRPTTKRLPSALIRSLPPLHVPVSPSAVAEVPPRSPSSSASATVRVLPQHPSVVSPSSPTPLLAQEEAAAEEEEEKESIDTPILPKPPKEEVVPILALPAEPPSQHPDGLDSPTTKATWWSLQTLEIWLLGTFWCVGYPLVLCHCYWWSVASLLDWSYVSIQTPTMDVPSLLTCIGWMCMLRICLVDQIQQKMNAPRLLQNILVFGCGLSLGIPALTTNARRLPCWFYKLPDDSEPSSSDTQLQQAQLTSDTYSVISFNVAMVFLIAALVLWMFVLQYGSILMSQKLRITERSKQNFRRALQQITKEYAKFKEETKRAQLTQQQRHNEERRILQESLTSEIVHFKKFLQLALPLGTSLSFVKQELQQRLYWLAARPEGMDLVQQFLETLTWMMEQLDPEKHNVHAMWELCVRHTELLHILLHKGYEGRRVESLFCLLDMDTCVTLMQESSASDFEAVWEYVSQFVSVYFPGSSSSSSLQKSSSFDDSPRVALTMNVSTDLVKKIHEGLERARVSSRFPSDLFTSIRQVLLDELIGRNDLKTAYHWLKEVRDVVSTFLQSNT